MSLVLSEETAGPPKEREREMSKQITNTIKL